MLSTVLLATLALSSAVTALSEREVCNRWESDYPTTEDPSDVWSSGAGSCSVGKLSKKAHDDAMRRTNLFRWLSGLPEAEVSDTNKDAAQECAMMIGVNGQLNHAPPTSWECYNSEGAGACGASNLAGGFSTPADSVDAYLVDSGVSSRGHRRWVLCPQMSDTGFGHWAGEGTGYGAMYVFGTATYAPQPDVKFPAEMWPIAAIRGTWSFASATRTMTGATVSVKNGRDEVATSVTHLSGGYCGGYDWVEWSISETPVSGSKYDVEITTTDSSTPITYTVEFTDCGSSTGTSAASRTAPVVSALVVLGAAIALFV